MAFVVSASAPGKLFVAGEYAVLSGAPALVAAVDRRALVRLAVDDRPGPLAVHSLAEGVRVPALALDAPLPGGDAGALVAALRAAGGGLAGRRTEATVDTRGFLADGRKLGLGRSAATLAAAASAFLALAGRDGAVLEVALAANALFQDGRGSGADVAAAVHGGLVEATPRAGGVAVVPRRLPAGLRLLAGWTGEAAPTAPLLARFERAAARRPAVLDALGAAAHAAAAAVAAGDAGELLAAVDRSADLLVRLGEALDLPIVTPALARLVATARRAGAAAKPSGAGAGDCGIALATSAAQAAAVEEGWRAAGIVPLGLTIDEAGARADVGGEEAARA